VNVYCLHPGVITTELGRYAAGNADLASKILHYMYAWMGFLLKTPWHGAQTTLHCCLSEELAQHTGR
jgi:retinol dehydrogenase-13